jgi:O-acetyl-ADP-ribose deacetylase
MGNSESHESKVMPPPIAQLAQMPNLDSLYGSKTLEAAPADTVPSHVRPDPNLNMIVSLVKFDITRMQVDAVVNAANRRLAGGGGVDGAIHRAAGHKLEQACQRLGGCSTGDAKVTPAFELPAKCIMHAVGPMWDEYEDKAVADALLRSCYRKCLELGEKMRLASIAFCPISTNIYGFPNERAAHVAIGEVRRFLQDGHGSNYRLIVFTVVNKSMYPVYEKTLPYVEFASNGLLIAVKKILSPIQQ